MKGLICTIEKYGCNENGERKGKIKYDVLCISDVHQNGVCIAYTDGSIETVKPDNLKIGNMKKSHTNLFDWRVRMGF